MSDSKNVAVTTKITQSTYDLMIKDINKGGYLGASDYLRTLVKRELGLLGEPVATLEEMKYGFGTLGNYLKELMGGLDSIKTNVDSLTEGELEMHERAISELNERLITIEKNKN